MHMLPRKRGKGIGLHVDCIGDAIFGIMVGLYPEDGGAGSTSPATMQALLGQFMSFLDARMHASLDLFGLPHLRTCHLSRWSLCAICVSRRAALPRPRNRTPTRNQSLIRLLQGWSRALNAFRRALPWVHPGRRR